MKSIFKKVGLIILGAALFAGMLTACSTSPESTTPIVTSTTATSTPTVTPTQTPSSFTIKDYYGREITIKNNHPQKIVSLAPSNTEILFALGLGDRIVGVTQYSDFPPEATTKPSVGAYDNPNIEDIVAMEPDLVLATDAQSNSIYQQLENRGLTVVAIVPHNIPEVLQSITLIGKITGQDKEAASLVADMQKRIDAVVEKTSKLTASEKPRVFYIIWHDPIWTTGNGTFEDSLIEMAGGINIAHALGGYVGMSLEALIDANPQIMIAGVGMGTGEDLPLQFVQTEPRLKDIDARKNDKVYSVDMNIVSRPGPRIVDALEAFFKIIHPELQ
ncbi:MAG: ABC transporter substrate-binding protein [Dehalococcoidales bacterium]